MADAVIEAVFWLWLLEGARDPKAWPSSVIASSGASGVRVGPLDRGWDECTGAVVSVAARRIAAL